MADTAGTVRRMTRGRTMPDNAALSENVQKGEAMQPPRILPPHYLVISVLLILGTAALDTAPLFASPWVYLGLLPMAAGITIAVQGSRQFAAAETNIIPLTESTTLVTDGVFAFSRNPMYLGMMLLLTGLAFIADNGFAWLVVVAFWLIIRFAFIRREERLMADTFGDAYNEYKSNVRRWF